MCLQCYEMTASAPRGRSFGLPRRGFLFALASAAVSPAIAQVDVGEASRLRALVPAGQIESASTQQYAALMEKARAQGALAPDNHPQLQRLRAISARLIAQSAKWNERSRQWRWEVNLIGSKTINAFCMPGGKIAVFTGILDQLQLTDDEAAMVLGHEIAHALREHARARIAKSRGTGAALSIGAQLLGLGQVGDLAANVGTQLITLKFSRNDEIDADLVGLEIAARAGFNPDASVTLWEKMTKAQKGGGLAFLSTHPSGPERITRLRENVPRVRALYREAIGAKK
ncbi:MAG: M48 family metallopeptidase [Ramlibacter sp.]|nr:M48 family metallopeptidase [Ramlibacter sp.]